MDFHGIVIFVNIDENNNTQRKGRAIRAMARSIVVTEMGLRSLQQTPLSKVEGVILWHLVEQLPVTGDVVSQTQLDGALSVDPAQINRAMKRLCELGYLIRGPKIGVSYHYKLNPAFFRILS